MSGIDELGKFILTSRKFPLQRLYYYLKRLKVLNKKIMKVYEIYKYDLTLAELNITLASRAIFGKELRIRWFRYNERIWLAAVTRGFYRYRSIWKYVPDAYRLLRFEHNFNIPGYRTVKVFEYYLQKQYGITKYSIVEYLGMGTRLTGNNIVVLGK